MNAFNTREYVTKFALYNLLIVVAFLFLILVTGCGRGSDLTQTEQVRRVNTQNACAMAECKTGSYVLPVCGEGFHVETHAFEPADCRVN